MIIFHDVSNFIQVNNELKTNLILYEDGITCNFIEVSNSNIKTHPHHDQKLEVKIKKKNPLSRY